MAGFKWLCCFLFAWCLFLTIGLEDEIKEREKLLSHTVEATQILGEFIEQRHEREAVMLKALVDLNLRLEEWKK